MKKIDRIQKEECQHGIKYRLEIEHYTQERGHPYLILTKESECNSNKKGHTSLDAESNHEGYMFVKNKWVSQRLKFDDIIELAYLYLEEHEFILQQNKDGNSTDNQTFKNLFQGKGLICQDENKFTAAISLIKKRELIQEGYRQAQADLLKNLFKNGEKN